MTTQPWIHRALDRVFGAAEEINGANRCPTYLYRWTLVATRWGKLYLHRFVGDDWSRDLHDHPKRFLSIGLWGSYEEESAEPSDGGCLHCDAMFATTPCPKHWWGEARRRTFKAPWIRTFAPEHRHRLRLIDGRECWTLVGVGPLVREWGFWPGGTWVAWHEYVKSDRADLAKDC